jgi:hypothetical protein
MLSIMYIPSSVVTLSWDKSLETKAEKPLSLLDLLLSSVTLTQAQFELKMS